MQSNICGIFEFLRDPLIISTLFSHSLGLWGSWPHYQRNCWQLWILKLIILL